MSKSPSTASYHLIRLSMLADWMQTSLDELVQQYTHDELEVMLYALELSLLEIGYEATTAAGCRKITGLSERRFTQTAEELSKRGILSVTHLCHLDSKETVMQLGSPRPQSAA